MTINAEQQSRLDALSQLLIEENTIHNLTRITDPQEIQLKHFADS
ncbi:MAG: class I SAM-dependent methyltransferase, partial [Sedimentisphaerales bacterium]|nr:class I SAM-dependent methyltransferase [Sedimentisphaerales bacterium]